MIDIDKNRLIIILLINLVEELGGKIELDTQQVRDIASNIDVRVLKLDMENPEKIIMEIVDANSITE